jgi:hypothetical protein
VPISAATDINPLKTLSPFTSTITNELSKCKRKFGSYRSVRGTFELSISSRPHSRIRRATTCDHRARRAEAGRIGALAADPRDRLASPGYYGNPRSGAAFRRSSRTPKLAAVSRLRAPKTA